VLLNDLSFWYFDVDVAKADASTQQALEIAGKIGDKKGLGWAHAYRGVYFFLSGILPPANAEFNQSIAISKSIGENNLQTYSLTQLGNSFRDKGVYDSAILFYKRAWESSLSNQDHKYQAVLKKNLVRYYLIRSQPDSAMVEAQKALQLTEQLRDPILMADVWMLLGNCYRAANNFVEAERYYRMTESVTRYDAVIKVEYLQNIGEIFFRRGDFQQSIKNWQQALNSSREYQYKYGLAELLFRMGNVFEEQGYYDLGTEYLAQALNIAEKSSYQYLIGKIAHEQCWIYYRTRNFELAFASYQRAMNMFKIVHADLDLAATWDLRGLLERNLGHYDSSLYYHTISLEGRNKFNNKVEVSASFFNIGEYYLTRKDYNQALGYYFKSLKIDLSIGENYGIR
jgi:tetratricopeptide (TPR) repeat protein